MTLIIYLITGALFGSIAMIWIVKTVHYHKADDHPVFDSGQTNRQG